MAISSNSLIHFTDKKENLKSILLENFRVNYCKENTIIGNTPTFAYVPMVSFCDIPLSLIKDHISKYGEYGIGLTREWAVRNKLNPVLYIEKDSLFSQSFMFAASYFLSDAQKPNNLKLLDDDYYKALCSLGDMRGYIKNYQANLTRKSSVIPDYRFADEREWRYVPKSQDGKNVIISDELYDTDYGKEISLKITSSIKLEFEPNDIKYVIIKDDSEIHEFVTHLRKAKESKYSQNDIDRLTTRILTTEQIMQDV